METNEKVRLEIIFLGDSFTNRTGVKNAIVPEKIFSTSYWGNYVEYVEKRLFVHNTDVDFYFYNMGKSGDTVFDLLNRIDKEIKEINPDIVVLLIGHNDIKKGLDLFFEDYLALINKLDYCCKRLIGISILPIYNHPEMDDKVKEFNCHIQYVLEQYGYDYLNLYDFFYEAIRNSRKKIRLYEETNHLSELGNIYIADCVYELINKYLKIMWRR